MSVPLPDIEPPACRVIEAVAMGGMNPVTKTFTVDLDRTVEYNPAREEVYMDLQTCKIPPTMNFRTYGSRQMTYRWTVTINGVSKWSSGPQNFSFKFHDPLETTLKTLVTIPGDIGHFINFKAGGPDGLDYTLSTWIVHANDILGVITAEEEEGWGDDQEEEFQDAAETLPTADDIAVTLTISPAIRGLLLGWPSTTVRVKNDDVIPAPTMPQSMRQTVHLMCEGAAMSSFQGTATRPYIATTRLTRHSGSDEVNTMGGVISPRAYRAPIQYRSPSGIVRQLRMWVEDDRGDRHDFINGFLICHIAWTVVRRDGEKLAPLYPSLRAFDSTVVVHFEGESGVWDMGRMFDWRASPGYEYQVALVTFAQTHANQSLKPFAGIGVTMPDFLADYRDVDHNLTVLPSGTEVPARRTGDDIVLEVAVPRYKRVKPVCASHSRVIARPITLGVGGLYRAIKTTIVLRLRIVPVIEPWKAIKSMHGTTCTSR